MPRRTPLLALAGAVVLAAGCTRAEPRPADPRDGIAPVEEPVPVRPVVMYFVNTSTVGAEVFATATPRDERRLGVVQPGATQRFVLPREAVRLGSTTVLARLHPSTRAVHTGTFTVNSGDVFTVSLANQARTLAVSPGRP